MSTRWVVVGATISTVVLAVAVFFIITGGRNTPASDAVIIGTSSLSLFLLIALVLFVVSFVVTNAPQKWLPNALKGLAALVVIIALAFSGVGDWAARLVNQTEACLGNQDCGPRAGDYPIINGGTVNFARGETKTFYVEGTVALTNFNSCYYLGIGPSGTFRINSEADHRVNYITARSGVRELAVVTSRRDPNC